LTDDFPTDDRTEDEISKYLSLMQEIDRALYATRDINSTMLVMLEAALTHTHASMGAIGRVDGTEKIWEEIRQITSEANQSTPADRVKLAELPWFSKGLREPRVLQCTRLPALLNIPEAYTWHYIALFELEADEFVLLTLHLAHPEQLPDLEVAFLAQLNEHALVALRHTYLYKVLKDTIQEKNEFISFISHELKTPLTVIKGYADILSKGMAGEVNDEQRDYLVTIAHNVRRMSTFITDLSDQSYIETKALRLQVEANSVNEVVNEVLQSYAVTFRTRGLQVHKQIPPDIVDVWCDRLRLIQILSNLVSNAAKYTPEGGQVVIGAETNPNKWDPDGVAEVVHFWVEDTGFGISPEDQAHMFEKFYRGSDTRKLNIPGSGLGLRIAKSLTEMMGGKMWFDSQQGEGTTFHFTMPI